MLDIHTLTNITILLAASPLLLTLNDHQAHRFFNIVRAGFGIRTWWDCPLTWLTNHRPSVL